MNECPKDMCDAHKQVEQGSRMSQPVRGSGMCEAVEHVTASLWNVPAQ